MILHKWFHENHTVPNPDKYHYIKIGNNDPSHKTILNNNEIAKKPFWYSFRQQTEH